MIVLGIVKLKGRKQQLERKNDYANKIYNLKYDRVFNKSVICGKDTRAINKILTDILEEEVEVIKYVPTYIKVKKKYSKYKTVDILAKVKDKIINVEINTRYDEIIKERNLVYYTSIYSETIKRGEKLPRDKVVQINLNYNKGGEKLKEKYYICEEESKKKYNENFKIITVNLEKYKEEWYKRNIEGDKRHIYLVMLSANKKELKMLSKQDEIVKEVSEEVFILNEDGSYTRTISVEEENRIIQKQRENLAYEKGEQKGINKTAIEMIKDGLDINKIIKYTNLSKKEINGLIKKAM